MHTFGLEQMRTDISVERSCRPQLRPVRVGAHAFAVPEIGHIKKSRGPARYWWHGIMGLLCCLGIPLSVYAEVVQIDNAELQALMKGGMPLIDVRTAPEWKETGMIEGSHLITFFDEYGRYDLPKWIAALDQIVDQEQPFALICAVGSRTDAITRHLSDKMGYKKVYNVTKGIMHWIEEKHSTVVVSGAGRTESKETRGVR